MKLFKTLDDKKIYLFSILSSLYLSYLFCRQWDFNIFAKLLIIICISFCLIYFTYLWNKRNQNVSSYKRCSKRLIIFLTFLFSFITLYLNMDFFTSKYVNSSLIISSKKEDISLDTIDNILLNNVVYYKNSDNFYTTYDEKYNKYEKQSIKDLNIKTIDSKHIQLSFAKKHSIKINFNKCNGISVIENNNITDIYDLENSSCASYSANSNTITDQFWLIRLIISFLILIYIYYMSLTYYIYSTKKERHIILLSFISLLVIMFYYNLLIIGMMSLDSGEYANYNFSKLLNLELSGRTPLYPLVIRIFQKIFSANFLEFVCFFQYFIFYISIIILYNIIDLISNNKNFALVGSLLYLVSPTIISWNNILLTESLALSGTMLFIYFIVKYIKTEEQSYAIFSIVTAFILTFHRPTSIIYLCGLLVFFVFKYIFEKKQFNELNKCFMSLGISFILIIIYAIIFHKTFGIYSISDAVVRQDLIVSIQEKYYKSSNDPKFIENIDTALREYPDNTWTAMLSVLNKYSLSDMKKHTNYCRRKNMVKYIKYIIKLYITHSSLKFEGYGYVSADKTPPQVFYTMYQSFSIINFFHVYLIMLIQLILSIKNWIIEKKPNWFNLGFFAFPFVIILSSFIGTCSEFMRTSIACIPFTHVSFIYLVHLLFKNKDDIKC